MWVQLGAALGVFNGALALLYLCIHSFQFDSAKAAVVLGSKLQELTPELLQWFQNRGISRATLEVRHDLLSSAHMSLPSSAVICNAAELLVVNGGARVAALSQCSSATCQRQADMLALTMLLGRRHVLLLLVLWQCAPQAWSCESAGFVPQMLLALININCKE